MIVPKFAYKDISDIVADDSHGRARKDMIVLHETVSPNYPGWSDIVSNARYLDNAGYGVQGLTDADGNIALALRYENAILYHAASGQGGVNTRSLGIEQVSRVMLDQKDNASRWRTWMGLDKEVEATAKLCAYWSEKYGIPLRYSDATAPGITTHWQVTQTWHVSGGHTDCWPKHLGGYYPVMKVIYRARQLREKWYGH